MKKFIEDTLKELQSEGYDKQFIETLITEITTGTGDDGSNTAQRLLAIIKERHEQQNKTTEN